MTLRTRCLVQKAMVSQSTCTLRVALSAKDISKYMIETGTPLLEFIMLTGTWEWGGDISKVDKERAPPGLDVTAF